MIAIPSVGGVKTQFLDRHLPETLCPVQIIDTLPRIELGDSLLEPSDCYFIEACST
jgi:hypothetical protein